MAESVIKLAWIQFRHLHFGAVLVPWSSLFSELVLFLILSRIMLSETLLSSRSQQVAPEQGPESESSLQGYLLVRENAGKSGQLGRRGKYLVSTPLWIFQSG